ncbi:MAG: M48 family metallopeptidase [Candidatus Nitronauta litoralis]|uniref:M48 family metallopeptidase n=1 Tax=Candidatus Nitronauta litoralis TaxID=2705533 RepID=A0A7T0BVU3_9BACT|nr:MAG: M48 family metallopeptidase [Candidatus Nitronauta litoralis]
MYRFLTTLLILLSWSLTGCTTTPVSGKSALILVPFSQEMQLGEQAFQQVLEKETLSPNKDYTAVVERVGRRIAAVTNMPNLKWEFRLIESDQLNAFALPGGKTAIYTAMLPVCKNEAGLAAVMGHEIAHVIARHGAQRMSQDMVVQAGMATAAISMADNSQRGMIMGALGLGAQLGVMLPFSRGMESEADEIGTIYMAKAGYDPAEAEQFWRRFASVKTGSQQPPEFLSTHPADATRINQIRRLLPKAQQIYRDNPNKYGLGVSFVNSGQPQKVSQAKQAGQTANALFAPLKTKLIKKKAPAVKPAPRPTPSGAAPAMHLDAH